ncbi:unnamed protein product [Aphanomyces euteiches]
MGLLEEYYRDVMNYERRPQGRRQPKKLRPKQLEKLDMRPQTNAKVSRSHPKERIVTALPRARNNQEDELAGKLKVSFKLAWRDHVAKVKPGAAKSPVVTATPANLDGTSIPFFPLQLLHQPHVNISPWTLLATDDTFFKIAAHNKRKRRLEQQKPSVEWTLGLKEQIQLHATGETKSIVANGSEQLTDAGLIAIAKSIASLECLEIAQAYRVTDAGMRNLALHCSNLTCLNISGCRGIAGAGLAAVSDHCHRMTSLAMAQCSQLEEWVLVRAFYNFARLTHLNLSGCTQIVDTTIKTMALQCRQLIELDLSFCPQITDTGMVFLAQHCRALIRLNVAASKNRFNERITDITLLSLGEHCPLLEKLNVFGCTFISDVGVQWLAKGCRHLTSLDLMHCLKLTDVAMRALGNLTPKLRQLRIGHAKSVSDVGLRFLSEGCPLLEQLHLKQLYLVSDGVKRDFGLEGLQAVAQSCTALMDLDLSGCFQVVERSLKSIGATCTALTKLNLKGCKNATPTGLGFVLRGCPALAELNLTAVEQCGNAVLQELGRCTALRELILAQCERITDGGLRHLHRLSDQLVVLNISGCKQITDVGMCAFVHSFRSRAPALETLILNGCPLITEDFLNVAALHCPLVLRLNVIGCGISTRVLSSLKTSWKYTVFRSTMSEMGFFPAHRAKERRFMEESGQLCLAAMKIQTIYRLRKARQVFSRQQEEARRHRVVRHLQSRWRGRRARQRALVEKFAFNKKKRAAMMIQRCFRRYRTKRKAQHQFEDLMLKRTEELAVVVQRRYRAVRGARIAQVARKAFRRWNRKRNEAATKMQKRWRGIAGRRKFKLAKAQREAQKEEEMQSATQLQAMIRGRQARKMAAARRQAELQLEKERNLAAIRLQCMYRQRIARRKLKARLDRQLEMHRAATRMQCAWRARQGRNFLGALRMAKERRDHENAATLVQQRWRKRQAYMNRVWEAAIRRNQNIARLKAACRLQLWWRNVLAIFAARAQMQQLLELKRRDDAMVFWAAQLVQSHFRGLQARQYFAELKQRNESRWKQVLDVDNAYGMGFGAPFYYNQMDGTIRWRMPSELLTKEPQPKCDQCELPASAVVECATCCEYFCPECLERIHAHGKRQLHVRRKMYNYYNKRIDYGDGTFPSEWPSEIDQDAARPWDFIHFVPKDGYDALVQWIAEEDRRLYLLKQSLLAPPPPLPQEDVMDDVVEDMPVAKPRAFDEDSHGNKIVFQPVGGTKNDQDILTFDIQIDVEKPKKGKRKKRPLHAKKKLLHGTNDGMQKSPPGDDQPLNEPSN